ncbi:MAG: adenylate/guanylate cyclase domain-containing protein [Deltaproteobacteria bacterium]|nr:adenylate/guanylate cyclase domain-containing protein [Deltaproteobacteria bacterium]
MERKLTAILCADVYGYSRLMGQDEEATLRTLSAYRKIIDCLIESHRGRFVNSAGDSVLAEFTSVVEAVNCAVEVQNAIKAENSNLPPERRMEFRIGVNSGDVMVQGEQIYGDGVNVAARLENLADPGGICISGTVHEQVRDKLPLAYEDRGEQAVKNIARPVRVWRVLPDQAAASRGEMHRRTRRYWQGGVLSVAGIALIAAMFVLVQHLSLRPQQTHASIPALPKPVLSLPSIPSIAVLPFTNLSGDPRQEYFSDGISSQLIDELSGLPGLFVIARNSSFAFKGKLIREREIGRELGVKYLLEGGVRKAADQLRIGVALVDSASGTQTWTARYDRPFKDVFAVQDEIVRRIVTTLGLIVKADQLNVPYWRGPPTDNLEAFDDSLRANNHLWRFTKDDNALAREWHEKAIELDPKFVGAYIGLGWTYFFDCDFQWTDHPKTDLERSIEMGQKALLLDDSSCEALALLSNDYTRQGQYDRAVAEGERAVSINPNCSVGYTFLGVALNAAGRPGEALQAVEKAMRLDPAGHDFYAGVVGNSYMLMGRYQEAIPYIQRSVGALPNALWAHLDLAIAYTEIGRDSDAHAEVAEVMRISPTYVLPALEKGPYSAVAFLAGKDKLLQRRFDADLRRAGLK